MGAAAYRRGSKVIREQIDRELSAKRTRVRCGGSMQNGPDKAFARCPLCGAVDYELYEGDRCRAMVPEGRR